MSPLAPTGGGEGQGEGAFPRTKVGFTPYPLSEHKHANTITL